MKIISLEVKNWKCFANKKKWIFEDGIIVSRAKNGTGKTSMFEGIIYAFTGKIYGFTFNTIRQNENKDAYVKVEFSFNDLDCSILRQFGSEPISELIVDGKLICESSRALDKEIANLLGINEKLLNIIWTQSLINSDSLSVNFFKETLLSEILENPNKVLAHFKSVTYQKNREISNLDSKIKSIKENSEDVKAKIDEIKECLKSSHKTDDSKLEIARSTKVSHDRMIDLEPEYKEILKLGLSNSEIREIGTFLNKLNFIVGELEEECKKVDTPFSNFSSKELKNIINHSSEQCKCLICGSAFSIERAEKLIETINNSGRSNEKIKKLEGHIDLCKKLTIPQYNLYNEYNKVADNVDRCPNWESIINSHDESVSNMWYQLDKLTVLYESILENEENIKRVNELEKEVSVAKEKISEVNRYVEETQEKCTRDVLNRASDYVSSINDRYKQIAIDANTFVIVCEDEERVLHILPVARLSNGEKTLIALSLLFACVDIFIPSMPLLFDEVFSALDKENLDMVKQFLNKRDTQILVLTHDYNNWEERGIS